MNLSEADNDKGYVVTHTRNENLLLQPGARIRVTVNDGVIIIFRILGSDARYSVPWNIAQEITIRKA